MGKCRKRKPFKREKIGSEGESILKIILRESVFEKKAKKQKIDKFFFFSSNKRGTGNIYF